MKAFVAVAEITLYFALSAAVAFVAGGLVGFLSLDVLSLEAANNLACAIGGGIFAVLVVNGRPIARTPTPTQAELEEWMDRR